MKTGFTYSPSELEMIRRISTHWHKLITEDKVDIAPIRVFEILAKECFLQRLEGSAVDSLRRCLKALEQGIVYRNSPEWEALIILDDSDVSLASLLYKIPFISYKDDPKRNESMYFIEKNSDEFYKKRKP